MSTAATIRAPQAGKRVAAKASPQQRRKGRSAAVSRMSRPSALVQIEDSLNKTRPRRIAGRAKTTKLNTARRSDLARRPFGKKLRVGKHRVRRTPLPAPRRPPKLRRQCGYALERARDGPTNARRRSFGLRRIRKLCEDRGKRTSAPRRLAHAKPRTVVQRFTSQNPNAAIREICPRAWLPRRRGPRRAGRTSRKQGPSRRGECLASGESRGLLCCVCRSASGRGGTWP